MSFSLSKTVRPGMAFLVNRSELLGRWDPNFYRCMGAFRKRVKGCPFPIEPLRQHLTQVQYGISERATTDPIGVPMLRMINLQDDAWDLSDMKYSDAPLEEIAPYLLNQGDILFNRTNSKELVGKCQVFDLTGNYVFASYLIRVRTKTSALLPDYVTAFLSLPAGRLLIDAVSRQIAGMTNINAEEIRELLIPRPDLPTQKRIVAAWKKALAEREQRNSQARQLLAGIDDLLLAELGIKLPPAPPPGIAARIFRRNISEITGDRFDPVAHQPYRLAIEEALARGRYPVEPLHALVRFRKDLVKELASGVPYLGLENVDGATGEHVASAEKESVGTALVFSANQILFPKLRPYLNKTHLAGFGGVCSTEFHVLESRELLPAYLTECLRSRPIVALTSMLMTGNTLPRLQTEDIRRLPIPLADVKTQQRIVTKIAAVRAEAKALRAAAATQLAAAKQEIEALLLGTQSS